MSSKSAILLLCRHAEAGWPAEGVSDFARPLTKRGERDAHEMALCLAEQAVRPDLILASSALRARTTASILGQGLGCAPDCLHLHAEQYGASVSSLLALLRGVRRATTVMLVGHNPETTFLANALGNLQLRIVPTCGVVALRFTTNWRDIREGEGALLFYEQPARKD